jgi:tetratricopeptide (TPR) repeat protein
VIEHLLRAENALALGLLDQAEQIYAQTLAHDPANAIAVVGLSRVALERGDERASLDLARRALSIDPENAQAGRMADRLEEVMRERGDAIPPAALPPGAVGRMAVPPDDSPTTAATPVAAPQRRGLLRRLTGRS